MPISLERQLFPVCEVNLGEIWLIQYRQCNFEEAQKAQKHSHYDLSVCTINPLGEK